MIDLKNKADDKSLSEDRHLFERISQNEYKALELLFNKYYDRLCVFGNLFEKDQMIIEEQISDVFMLLWNKRETLRTINNPKSYMYVIARNQLIKKSTYVKHKHYLEDKNENQLVFKVHPSFEEEVIDQEQKIVYQRALSQILKEIPKKSREIFEMSRVDGLKYKEISELKGISPRTVENHIATALRLISKKVITLNL
ncbi:sigma-70 family RNA polymerase sigma factor [Leeuwenhoekiella aequorea]|uniref:RNA polymerase sigma factor n=1 Tax=Leeuwenhoekiella TaxID=283735 RepID=UPI00068A230A|nr:sigma-70 family RNA polymerase sigma factor [Leeuwenhoekiella sp. MAR_2009_132]|tara:strand:+ start:11058 stop:11651 length:594 start_codon:yes stop_codon:yes gene_type:complete